MKKTSWNWLMCGLVAAATLLTGNSLLAQNDNGNGAPGGGGQGGPGGGARQRNFDPARMQQMMLERIQDQLGFTNDTDWSAVEPLVTAVLTDERDARGPGMGALFGRGGGGGRGGQGGQNRQRGGGMFGTPSAEATALQNALDQNAPSGQVKDLLAKYQASQKAKQAKLEQAQSDLRAVLTPRQEAQATLLGLLN